MIEKYFFEILIALVFVISLMSTVIFFLWKKVKQQRVNERDQALRIKEKEEFILSSLDIIAKAVLQGQCELSEGCIRIRMLLTKSHCLKADDQNYETIFTMYEDLKNFKTHEQRKSLTKQERFQEDANRMRVEDNFKIPFLKAVSVLAKEVKEFL
ncbi:hypothetical protein A9Q84_09705 [Halobacteriovorax marinus]|uniref:DUF2489 domain-containing protein n=1 Tax=Halobacteriovorax marinus TaxID=97084 RepID=A0A1Y5FCN0_9BACT|nr:hypothetical protein A9Q84_09705 [Halobacteriovorax marinus]